MDTPQAISDRSSFRTILRGILEPVSSIVVYWALILLLTSWPTEEIEDYSAPEAKGGYQEGGLPGGAEGEEGEVVIGLAPAFGEEPPSPPAVEEPPAAPPPAVPPAPAEVVAVVPPSAPSEVPPERLPPEEAAVVEEAPLEPPSEAVAVEGAEPDPFAILPTVFDPEAAAVQSLSEEEAALADAAAEAEQSPLDDTLPGPATEAADDAPLEIRYGRPTTASRTVGVARKQAALARIAARKAKAGQGTAKGPKDKKDCLPDDPRISEVGTNDFELSQELVDYYTSHMNQAMKLAATYWHKDEEGDIDGFTVRRMRCGSTLHQLGFRNGDVIHAINGKKIQSIASALTAFRRAKRKEVIRVDITRKEDGVGQEVRLRFRIT